MDISATDFLKKGIHIAEFFGFKNINILQKHPTCKSCNKKLTRTDSAADRKKDALYGLLTSGMATFCDAKLHEIEEPVMFYTIEQIPRSADAVLSLQVFNVDKSIAEAIIIHTSKALASELGYENHTVRINSLGDRDSSMRYVRELTNYLKKRMEDMPDTARELMKEHTLSALSHLIEKKHELAYKSPNPLEYLTDKSRKHFREIIEYLDLTEAQYEIDPTLIGHHQCYSDALFCVDLNDEEGNPLEQTPVSIKGGRYNEFVYRHTKQQIPAVGALLILHNKKVPSRIPRVKLETPSVAVVQLGFGPKIKSLMLVDELRKAGIVVHQNLASDSLSEQLRFAEAYGVYYTIITGQKEFTDGEVILRNMRSQTQESIPLESLITRLKRSPHVENT